MERTQELTMQCWLCWRVALRQCGNDVEWDKSTSLLGHGTYACLPGTPTPKLAYEPMNFL